MAAKKVAVVTGSNKGIGFAIVRGLCKSFQGDVILTARNETLGQQAVSDLNKEGLHPQFHQLDICDQNSINVLTNYLQSKYGGLDVLVNNAGIAYKQNSTAPFAEQAEVTVKTNLTGTLDVCNSLFPLLKAHARVVNVSSMSSSMSGKKCSDALKARFIDVNLKMDELQKILQRFVEVVNVSSLVSSMSGKKCSDALKARFLDVNLKMDELKEILQRFVDSAKNNKMSENGFPESAYGMSKVGVTVMSFIQQRDLDGKDDIIVNACCPGYVDTDMTSHKGTKTIDEGADTPIYLALLPQGTDIKGKFVSGRKVQEWP